jgi:hypothetical protein
MSRTQTSFPAQAAMETAAMLLQESEQRRHIWAQRIIISLPAASCSHIAAHIRQTSAHIPHIRGLISDMRDIERSAIVHISAQS